MFCCTIYLARLSKPAWSKGDHSDSWRFDVCSWSICAGQASYDILSVQSRELGNRSWWSKGSQFPDGGNLITARGGSLAAGSSTGVWNNIAVGPSDLDVFARGASRFTLAALAQNQVPPRQGAADEATRLRSVIPLKSPPIKAGQAGT